MPELGGEVPAEVCLAEAGHAHDCGLEMGGKLTRDAAMLRPIVEKHRLSLFTALKDRNYWAGAWRWSPSRPWPRRTP